MADGRGKTVTAKGGLFHIFLDGHTVSDSHSARLYSRYVRVRIRRDRYELMPEVALIRWKVSQIR
ncbi:MAG: hypothetical protein JXA30_22380 [Deltaproteobacteria bacterium]|nr:hypothetical protein [Deltaproteobacteria bacterium]